MFDNNIYTHRMEKILLKEIAWNSAYISAGQVLFLTVLAAFERGFRDKTLFLVMPGNFFL